MSSSVLMRAGGLAAILGGILVVIAEVFGTFAGIFGDMAVSATTASFAFTFWLYMLGRVLLLGGLVALYVYQLEAAGGLGLLGFILAFLGTALVVGSSWGLLFIGPLAPEILTTGPPTGFILTLITAIIGWVLFGIATLRARIYPRWAAVLLIVGAVVSFLPLPLSGLVLSAAVIWLGYIVVSGSGVSTEQPSRVS